MTNEQKLWQRRAGILTEGEYMDAIEENPTAPQATTPADVKSLEKAQSTASAVQGKAKNINSPSEFPGAFEAWFNTLGFQPGKLSKSVVRQAVDGVLTKLGYK
jgi:hypothetical protein